MPKDESKKVRINPPKKMAVNLPAGTLPPQNIIAEQSVLGAILLDKEAIFKIVDKVSPIDFYRPDHALIFEAMLKLTEKRQPVDVLTLSDQLEKDNQLNEIGGASYLSELVSNVGSAANIGSYATIIQNTATLRNLIRTGSDIIELGFATDQETDDLIDQAEKLLYNVSQHFLKAGFIPIQDILSITFERIDELHKNKGQLRGIPTGYKDLDNLLAGMQNSDLIIIAARPSMGKTTLALNIAAYAAIKAKIPVGIFSLEQSQDQLVDRLLVSEAGVDSWKLRTGNLSDEDFPRIGYAMGVLSEAPIYIDDSPLVNIMEMRAKARRLQAEKGLGLLIVDYLQLMSGRSRGGDNNRVQEISEISRGLKGIARELNVPLIALSQLSRAVEMRQPKIPQLADLRESGCLSGDTLIFDTQTGKQIRIDAIVTNQTNVKPLTLNNNSTLNSTDITRSFSTGVKTIFKITTMSGKSIKATANHKFLTINGWQRLDALFMGLSLATPRQIPYHPIGKIRSSSEKANSDIYWDKIISIQPAGKAQVYDLTIDQTHNFVANDIIVHNSIEQDADVVAFIYREEYYEPETERKHIADIMIKKHRNGPIGNVELFFIAEQMKFTTIERSERRESQSTQHEGKIVAEKE